MKDLRWHCASSTCHIVIYNCLAQLLAVNCVNNSRIVCLNKYAHGFVMLSLSLLISSVCGGSTHWPLGDLDAILKLQFSISFYWLLSWHGIRIKPWDECQGTSPMISQLWFSLWLGAVRQQAITWANVDLVPCHHMVSPGHNELIILIDPYSLGLLWVRITAVLVMKDMGKSVAT